ncbi:hypothetical protein QUF90_18845 [Desulfococcaceae bacterium HSG9]|nr:hypothetical protein [Desulfococcaceae bacterium HSG9]
MKKTIFVAKILLLCLLICGCPPKTKVEPVKTDRFEALFAEGLKYESLKEWQKAQTAFQASIVATSDVERRQTAQDRLVDVKKQIRLQALYEQFIDYQKRELSDKMRETLSEAHLIAPDNPYVCKMMDVLKMKHSIRPGDLISKLCQHYYGKTEGYELVKRVNAYNKITNPEKIETGQVVIFPVIDLPGKPLYFPNPNPPPDLPPRPAPSPQPTETGETKMIPRQCLEKGIGFFNDRQFQEAIVQFETCASQNKEGTTVYEWLSRSYFQSGLNLYAQGKYPQALNAFKASHKNFAGCSECKKFIKKTEMIILQKQRDKDPILVFP